MLFRSGGRVQFTWTKAVTAGNPGYTVGYTVTVGGGGGGGSGCASAGSGGGNGWVYISWS